MKNNTLKKILVFSMLVVAVLACAALFVVVIDVVRKDSGIISDIDMSSDHIDGEEADQNTTDTADSSDDLVTDDNVFTFSEADRKYYNTDTLIKVNTFDYYSDSITGLSDTMYTEEEMYRVLEEKGAEFAGTCGMPLDEYQDAMNRKWTDCTEYDQEVITTDFSLSEKYHYTDIVETMKILSRHEGVYLYDIGETTEGNTMYAIEIDVPSDEEKQTVVLTGTIHARETAGTTYILKELSELLEEDTEDNRNILAHIRFAIVPCVNPDGREGVAFDTENFTYSSGLLWKATSDGTDLNRNFPGLAFSQIADGNKRSKYISDSPDKIFYPGKHGGSSNETKAMMKFLYHFIVREHAPVLIDYHQQGAIGYAGKPWDSAAHQKACQDLADDMFSMMNKGNSRKYHWEPEPDEYGLNGSGSTLTDFACSVAYGAKFSPAYGFFVYTDGVNEYLLSEIPRMDESNIEFDIPNDEFKTMTFEIGYGSKYLGYSESTRKKLETEYWDYHFDKVFLEIYKYLYSQE